MSGKVKWPLGILVGLLGLLLLTVLLLPFWLGIAIGWLGGSFGLSYREYEREGYTRFVLHDLSHESGNLRFGAERFAAPNLFGLLLDDPNEIRLSDYEVTLLPDAEEGEEEPGKGGGFPRRLALAEDFFGLLGKYGVKAEATGGSIHFGEGEGARTVKLSRVAADAEGVIARITLEGRGESVDARIARLGNGLGWDLTVAPYGVNTAGTVERAGDGGAEVEGTLAWEGGGADFQARIPAGDFIPERASAGFSGRVPLDPLGLSPDQVRGYAPPVVAGEVEWDGDRYRVSARSEVEGGQRADRPPLDLNVRAVGDFEGVTVEALDVEGPWFALELSEPLGVDFADFSMSDAARLRLSARLDEQELVEAGGAVEASISVRPAPDLAYPRVEGRVEGVGLRHHAYEFAEVAADFALAWPDLTIGEGRLSLPQGSTVRIDGRIDLAEQGLTGVEVRAEVNAGDVRRHLSAAPAFESLAVDLRVEGEVFAPRHEGNARVRAIEVGEQTVDEVELRWQGEHLRLENWTLSATMPNLSVDFRGSAALGGETKSLTLAEGRIDLADHGPVILREPSTITHAPELDLSVGRLALAGEGGGPRLTMEAEASGRASGRLSLSLQDAGLDWFRDLPGVALFPYPGAVAALEFEGRWDNGPLDFSTHARLRTRLPGDFPFTLSADIAGGGEGLTIENLHIRHDDAAVLEASGILPVVIRPAAAKVLAVASGDPIRLRLDSAPPPSVARWLDERFGLEVEGGELLLNLDGTLRQPRGRLRLAARSLKAGPQLAETLVGEGKDLPQVSDLSLEALFQEDGIALEEFRATVLDAGLEAVGELPMGVSVWEALVEEGRLPDLARASAKLRLPETGLARFEGHLPELVRPRGTVSLDAELRPGYEVEGTLALSGIGTAPRPPLGGTAPQRRRRVRAPGKAEPPRRSGRRAARRIGLRATRMCRCADARKSRHRNNN